MENLKIFNTQEEYQTWKDSDDYVYPNVCKVGDEVIYNGYPEPFWIGALEDVNVNYYYYDSSYNRTEYGRYSYDKVNWTYFDNRGITLRTGTKLYIIAEHKFQRLYVSGKYNVGGSLLSLVYGKEYLKYNSHPQSFFIDSDDNYFFSKALNVVEAKELVIPTNMEYHTSSEDGQYCSFFRGCKLLKSAPRLKATTMQVGAYEYMYRGCESLTKAPTLPMSTIKDRCYFRMFYQCKNLSFIKMLSTTAFSVDYGNTWSFAWVEGVSPTGTFIANAKRTDFTRGVNGIPKGWDLYLYDEENDRYVVKFSVNGIPYEFYTDEPRYVKWSEFIDSEQNTNDFRKGYWNDATETAVTVRGIDNVLLSGKIVNSFENIVLNASYTIGEPTETTEVTESTNEEE